VRVEIATTDPYIQKRITYESVFQAEQLSEFDGLAIILASASAHFSKKKNIPNNDEFFHIPQKSQEHA
jgi:hypothetical protein